MPTVLVVDDKSENVYLLQTLLKSKGFEVQEASNGQEALEYARRRPPDLIIADILMPVMDGFSLCRSLKKETRLQSIPFIFYTATYTDPRDEEFALSLGADLFVTKPKSPEVLLQLILDVMSKKKAGGGMTTAPEEVVYLQEYNQTLIRKLEAKVMQLEEANRALALKDFAITSAISGILLVDLKATLTYVNLSCAAMWGYARDELVGKGAAVLFADADEVTRLTALLRKDHSWIGELKARRRDGTTFIVQMAAHRVVDPQGAPLCVMASCTDVTEQNRMREELQRSQRMESLSIFAAGIAHDFNNLLTGLFVGLELMKDELAPSSPSRDQFAIVMSVFSRARDLTQRLLAFAKGGSPVRKKLAVSDIIRESCALSLSGSRIRHQMSVEKGLRLIDADANQLSQVFNNIIINARQAMDDQGTLDISLGNRTLSAGEVAALPAGEYVEIHFKDSGPGIPEKVLPRIFDPFFTTKQDGSGLGLATSYAIVNSHGGHVEAASRPGEGASFHVWLPALKEWKLESTRAPLPDGAPGGGRVLLMDDEEAICKLVRHILVRAGYEVSVASNGQEAVHCYRQAAAAHQPFDLAILDLTIRGGMGGEETLAELRTIDPHAAAIASTGYSDANLLSQMKQLGFIGVLPKPYLAHELLSTVKAMIAREESTRA